jgi:hypothetical protein
LAGLEGDEMLIGGPDRHVIGALNPRAFVGYLRSKGWEKKRDFGDNATIFGLSVDGTEHELLVPVASHARDFTKVMEVTVRELAEIEDRSPYELVSDLSMAAFDVIRVCSVEADDIGSVELNAGVELHERARDMVRYAASAAASDEPRPTWQGRRSEQVDEYLKSLRLGQSQRGSFVISLLSPWDFMPLADRIQARLGFIDPFGRRTTKVLASALEAVGHALRVSATESVVKPFAAAVAKGVSANLCQALAEIARDGVGADISVRWSLTKPEDGYPMLRLTREDAQPLTEAAQSLSENEPLRDVTLHGLVTHLKEEPRAFDGVTTIEAPVGGRLRRVKVLFPSSDNATRDTLIDAFRERKRIKLTGDLTQQPGRRLQMEHPRDLAIDTSSEDE